MWKVQYFVYHVFTFVTHLYPFLLFDFQNEIILKKIFFMCCPLQINQLVSQSVSSVAQLCPTLCGPMNCSIPGFPVHHQLPEFTQTHVHWVSDATQPSHPLSSPSPALIFPSIMVFASELALHIRWPKYWSFSLSISPSNEYSIRRSEYQLVEISKWQN